MAKFIVGIREVHVSYREVEAESPEAAVEEAGGATEVMIEYSHTLDPELWSVEAVADDEKSPGSDVLKP